MLETLPKITIKRTFNVICSIYHLMWMLRLISLVIAYNPISIIARRHTFVDPHFSRAPPLDRRDSLFIREK